MESNLQTLSFTARLNGGNGFEILLWKILGIEGNHKICLAEFGAEEKRVVLGIGRNLSRSTHLHLFGLLADQVDDFSDEIWTNAVALQNFLVFFQNIFRYEPDEIVPLGPPTQYIGTRIPARNERLSEPRYTSHKDARVNDGPWVAFLSLLQVPVSWVYGRTRKRSLERIPSYRLGKYWRFRQEEVLAWVESQRRGSHAA